MVQLIDGEPEGPREVMNETYDKSMPIHNPPPRPDEPQTVYPFVMDKSELPGDKDFRPINQIDWPEAEVVPEVDEAAEVEEVLTAPKDSPAPESVESSTSEPTPESESPAPPEKTAPVVKDSGQPKAPESGSQTSSLPPMIGVVELPAVIQPQSEESQTPGSPAKQS